MYEDIQYKKTSPHILSNKLDNMNFIKNIILVVQTPPDGYAYAPNYISSGPQTHFAIYKVNDDKLELLYDALLIVYDGCSGYIIHKNINIVLQKNGLSRNDIDYINNNPFNYTTPIE